MDQKTVYYKITHSDGLVEFGYTNVPVNALNESVHQDLSIRNPSSRNIQFYPDRKMWEIAKNTNF